MDVGSIKTRENIIFMDLQECYKKMLDLVKNDRDSRVNRNCEMGPGNMEEMITYLGGNYEQVVDIFREEKEKLCKLESRLTDEKAKLVDFLQEQEKAIECLKRDSKERAESNLKLIEIIQRRKLTKEQESQNCFSNELRKNELLELVKDLKKKVAHQEKRKSVISSEIKEAETNLEHLRAKIAQQQASIQSKESRNKALAAELEELRLQEKTIRGDVKALKTQINHETLTNKKLVQKEDQGKKELKSESAKNRELLVQRNKLKKHLVETSIELNKRTEQLALIRKANSSMGEKLLDLADIENHQMVEEAINKKLLLENEILKSRVKLAGKEGVLVVQSNQEQANSLKNSAHILEEFLYKEESDDFLPSSSERLSELEMKIANTNQKFENFCSWLRPTDPENLESDPVKKLEEELMLSSSKMPRSHVSQQPEGKKLHLLTLDE